MKNNNFDVAECHGWIRSSTHFATAPSIAWYQLSYLCRTAQFLASKYFRQTCLRDALLYTVGNVTREYRHSFFSKETQVCGATPIVHLSCCEKQELTPHYFVTLGEKKLRFFVNFNSHFLDAEVSM